MSAILVLDDRRHDRKLVVNKLANRGYRVSTIADAAVTCASVQSLRPDVVLLNALSGRFDCLQVLVRIKRRYPRLPVIAYTVKRPEAVEGVVEAVAGLLDGSRLSERKGKRRQNHSAAKL